MSDATPYPAPSSPHALLPLFFAFMDRRRRGFAGLPALLAETGLSRPALFLLLRVAERPEGGSTADELRPGAPYATRDPHLSRLAEATERGFLARDGDRYRLTERGRATAARLEREGTAYLAALRPLPEDELARLADTLETIAAGLDREAIGPEAHLLYAQRLAALAPESTAAPLVRIERAVFALWMARDDAHIAAWRTARFPGPPLAVLTALWRGEADSLADLQRLLAGTQDPADVEGFVEELIEQGYIGWKRGALEPTRAGYNVREAIEADTDDRYFRQWPPLDHATLAWTHDALARLVAALPDTPLATGQQT
jgi:hypothetical protein